METIVILASLLAIVATILAFIYIVPEKKRDRLNKFGKFLHDTVNFKYLIVEKILQFVYILATAFVILVGFFALFYVEEYGYGRYTHSEWYGGYGLLMMILGPIAIRLTYEFIMMAILLIKNVIQINNKLKAPEESQENGTQQPAGDPFAAAPYQAAAPFVPAAPAAPAEPASATYCPYCGAKVEGGKFCGVCGKQI